MVVGDILRKAAQEYPYKVGVVFGDKRFTWQEINNRVNGLANALLGMHLEKQSRVAILSRNCNEYLECNYAAAKAGLVALPINVRLSSAELQYVVKHAEPRALIINEDFIEAEKTISGELGEIVKVGIGDTHPYYFDYETLIRQSSKDEPAVRVDEDDLWMIAYTSGTMGSAKGVKISHRNAAVGEITLAKAMKLTHEDIYLLSGPFYFNAGGGTRLGATWAGCTLVIMTFEAGEVLKTIEKERVTCFHGGTAPLSRLVYHHDVYKYNLSSVRWTMVTGSKLHVSLWKRAEQVFGPIVTTVYGLTETIGNGCFLFREEVAFEGPAKLTRRVSSVGRPLSSVELKVIDEDGQLVADDGKTAGEVIIKGTPVTKGYWKDPERTAQVIKDGWIYTGDIATIDKDGYIYIVDRKSDMIKSGGMQIFPSEVENVIYAHPAVKHCAVFKVPHPEWGETPKALIVLREGAKATEEEIIELCKKNIASYKKPTSVEFVDSLPMTERGKILKKELLARYWKESEPGSDDFGKS